MRTQEPRAPTDTCYLCGERLCDGEADYDHVPPRRFYPRSVRRLARVRLLRVPAHRACNRAFQLDEEYFFSVLVPFAAGLGGATVANDAFSDLRRALRRPEGRRLVAEAGYFGELEIAANHSPDAVGEPDGLPPPTFSRESAEAFLAKLDRVRLERVAWKITRGLAIGLRGAPIEATAERRVDFGLAPDGPSLNYSSWECLPGDGADTVSFLQGPEDASARQILLIKFWGRILVTVSYSASARSRDDTSR
jgi:hypothetical protein